MKELQKSRKELTLVSTICSFLTVIFWIGGLCLLETMQEVIATLIVALAFALVALFAGIKTWKINEEIFRLMESRE